MSQRSSGLVWLRCLVIAWMMTVPWIYQAQAASPRLNFTWRQEVHNAYFHGVPTGSDSQGEPFADGPKQHILDSLYIDRARGIELDLHVDRTPGNEGWKVYHTDREEYSLCVRFEDCLKIVRAWHFGNPLHDVFFLHLEAKQILPNGFPFFGEQLFTWDDPSSPVTPEGLDALLSQSLRHGAHDLIFGPKDYYAWCESTRLPALYPDPATRPALDPNDLRNTVLTCGGWPTMEELRGKFIVTLHGNHVDNETYVHDYSHRDGRVIRNMRIFPMASVLNTAALGDPCPIGGVCNWEPHSIFADIVRPLNAVDFGGAPFYNDPTSNIRDFINEGGIVRSADAQNRAAMANVIDNIQRIPQMHGNNVLATDAPRNYPVNFDKAALTLPSPMGPLNWSSGCLFQATGSSTFIDTCHPDDLKEPNAGLALSVQGAGGGIEKLVLATSDANLLYLYMDRLSANADLRAFVSTRTESHRGGSIGGRTHNEHDYEATFTGNWGCLMARQSPQSDAPYFAICRHRHRNSRDSDTEGAWVLWRLAPGAPTLSNYYNTTAAQDMTGIAELQNYFRLSHNHDGSCFAGFIRSTDDPVAFAGFTEEQLGPRICFAQPLNLIGFATDGGMFAQDNYIGDYLFANARYHGRFLTMHDFTDAATGQFRTMNTGAALIDLAERSYALAQIAAAINQPPVAQCQPVTVSAGPACTAQASIDNGSYDPNPQDTLTLTQAPAGPYPKGTTMVTLTVTDSSGAANASATCVAPVTVVDQTPPTITAVSASPNVLTPPNHKMRPVSISVVATDNCSSAPSCRVTTITSNEPQPGEPDVQITGLLAVSLRAERDGSGNGRLYTSEVTCTDADNNSAQTTTTVSVPHDRRKP